MRPAPASLLPALLLLACGAAAAPPARQPPTSPSPALTLRSTETHLPILALDADGTVHVGPCRVGALHGRRFEGTNGEILDFAEGSARLTDGRMLVWAADRVEQHTPTGVLSVAVETDGTVRGGSSAGGTGSGARYDALPSDAIEPALTLAAVYFFVGRAPCEPVSDFPDYL